MIKLTVTRITEDPEKAKRLIPYNQYGEPAPYKEYTEILNVEITEEEFTAIKKAVLEVIK